MIAKHATRTTAGVLIALVLVAISSTSILSVSWNPALEISQNQAIQEKDSVDLAVSGDEAVAVWAGSSSHAGIHIARLQDGSWTRTLKAPTLTFEYAWSPKVAHSGSSIGIAWAQGTKRGVCDAGQRIVQYDIGGTTRTVGTTFYGSAIAPDIIASSTGWHMVFAAATSSDDCRSTKVDLYYSYRSSTTASWSTPVPIVTSDQVLPAGTSFGGIWYPRIAEASGTSNVHVVWEQVQAPPLGSSIWRVTGTVAGGKTTWSPPERLSPTSQQHAVRPRVASGASGQIHVVWTEAVGSRTNPSGQNIYYRQPQNPTPVMLNAPTEPVLVTSNFPTLASSSVAAKGQTVCVSWHGYSDPQGTGSGLEEITVRCSQNGGTSWQARTNVSESTTWLSIFPAVALDDSGLMHFAWAEYQLDETAFVPRGVFYRNSEGSGDDGPGKVFLPLVIRGR